MFNFKKKKKYTFDYKIIQKESGIIKDIDIIKFGSNGVFFSLKDLDCFIPFANILKIERKRTEIIDMPKKQDILEIITKEKETFWEK